MTLCDCIYWLTGPKTENSRIQCNLPSGHDGDHIGRTWDDQIIEWAQDTL